MIELPKPPSLPGTKLEEACAEVGTSAGKSLVRGIARLGTALTASWVATKTAEAEAAALLIETEASIARQHLVEADQRARTLAELEHQALLRRRLMRLKHELEREQENLEAIQLRALEATEQSADAQSGRDIDDDWMFAFARHAQEVSDERMQEWWARILSSASISTRSKLSPTGLQTMTLVDRTIAIDFERLLQAVATFGYYPAHDNALDVEHDTQKIDLLALKELGLVQKDPVSGMYAFDGFELQVGPVAGTRIGLLHTSFSLTRRGREIADAVFGEVREGLSPSVKAQYIEDIVAAQMAHYFSIKVLLRAKPGEVISPFSIVLTHPRLPSPQSYDLSPVQDRISEDLERLLAWAKTRFDVASGTTMPPPPDMHRRQFE
jgi:hypothetical protein